MDLPNAKELRAILKLCREQGVTDISIGTITVKFGDLPREPGTEPDPVSVTGPSEEELLFWSSQPDPLAMRGGAEQ